MTKTTHDLLEAVLAATGMIAGTCLFEALHVHPHWDRAFGIAWGQATGVFAIWFIWMRKTNR